MTSATHARAAVADDAGIGAAGGSLAVSVANGALKTSAVLWFLVAAAGQWLFVVYIVGFFGPSTLTGNFEAWDKNKMLFHGYVAGDTAGNLAFAAHVLMAAVVTFGGTLQLIPQIRSRALWFHRWNGRVFIFTAFAISLAGLFLHFTRGHPSASGLGAITLNAVLIMFCAGQALGFALARDIDTHRRWALRTFMVVNGVWFLRVGVMAWMMLTQSSMKQAMPFIIFWGFASYLLPLLVLELYFRAERGNAALGKFGVSLLIFASTAAMAVGIFGAFMFLWRPLLVAA
jgi:hypothetical protein